VVRTLLKVRILTSISKSKILKKSRDKLLILDFRVSILKWGAISFLIPGMITMEMKKKKKVLEKTMSMCTWNLILERKLFNQRKRYLQSIKIMIMKRKIMKKRGIKKLIRENNNIKQLTLLKEKILTMMMVISIRAMRNLNSRSLFWGKIKGIKL